MNYSSDDSMVRVDFFRPSGKWYSTEAIKWKMYSRVPIHQAFKESLSEHCKGRMVGMTAVCLNPYHEHAHPLMVKLEDES